MPIFMGKSQVALLNLTMPLCDVNPNWRKLHDESSGLPGKLHIFHVGTSMPLVREDPPFFAHLVTAWDAFI